tara:strand:+ start:1533 stop:1655 length:123 start_codon:yes stop_codon:yes gene_type:complete
MQKKETQQFAKFFLKDVKSKSEKEAHDKSNADLISYASTN